MRRRNFIALLSGAAIAWPLLARTQQAGKLHRIAFVHPANPVALLTETGGLKFYRVFFEELRRLGYAEGQNLIVHRYSGEGRTERYAELARDVIRTKPDLIFTVTNRMVLHFKAATTAIPIVALTADPIASGIVASLARPGGNVTGVVVDAGFEIWGKRIELLRQAVPTTSRMAFLVPRRMWEGTDVPQHVQAAREIAKRIGISLTGAPVDDPTGEEQYRRTFATLAEKRVDALLVSDAAENFTNRRIIVELAAKSRLPTIYPWRENVEIGGLMAYVADLSEIFRYLAGEVGQILKGTNPGDIPFYQATKFELVINLKAAEALGLMFPPALLLFASEAIE